MANTIRKHFSEKDEKILRTMCLIPESKNLRKTSEIYEKKIWSIVKDFLITDVYMEFLREIIINVIYKTPFLYILTESGELQIFNQKFKIVKILNKNRYSAFFNVIGNTIYDPMFSENKVQVIDIETEKILFTFPSNKPRKILHDEKYVYILGMYTINVYDYMGNNQYFIGTRGENMGKMGYSFDFALRDSKIYVAEFDNNRVSIFSTSGAFERIIDLQGLLTPVKLFFYCDLLYVTSLVDYKIFDPQTLQEVVREKHQKIHNFAIEPFDKILIFMGRNTLILSKIN